ncbi:hypothetical protein ACFRMQ_29335 [Kitasatospora sp. NPDC056783]|uniref:hypothetical protein n=1 Tax=Kitasatospora sp. NPDC056783 TaxID=3345943 RepID=UPI00368CB0F4
MRHHQLFLINLHRPRCPGPPRGKRRGRPRLPDPAPALPSASGWVQPTLFEARRDFTRFDRREHARLDNPWLAWARHVAHSLGEAHGWPRGVCLGVDRALVIVLSGHTDCDIIRHTELFPALRPRGLSVERTVEVLDRIGVFLDDRPSSFDLWLESKLDGLAAGIRRDVQDWARLLHDGGTRSQPRDVATVWGYLNRLRPVLLEWSNRYDHLREVTRDDVLAHLETVHGSQRKHTLVALRSLFTRAKKNGTIFKNPTSRIRVGQQENGVIQPLESEDVRSSVAAVTRPADRLILALAAVHAARPGAIRRLQLDDLDIGNRRLAINSRVRPLDELTLQTALAWLEHRRRRWPYTANPHLLINKQTALESGPISGVSISTALRGQTATLERLRVDRQLEEALVHGPDPLHLAEVFGLDEKTAIRYADSARALLEHAAEADPASWSRTPSSVPGD